MVDDEIISNDIDTLLLAESVSCDTSSIIRLDDLGLFDTLFGTTDGAVRGIIPTGVAAELSGRGAFEGIASLRVVPADAETTDRQVVEIARRLRVPVLSEDAKILRNAERFGIDAYNAGMIIAFLSLKDKISIGKAYEIWEILDRNTPYTAPVRDYCRSLLWYIERHPRS